MGKSSKDKGGHYERRVVADHHEAKITCHKIPLSGAMQGYKGDIRIWDHWQGEVKARKAANGFKVVRDWLGDNDVLFLQEIGQAGIQIKHKPIVVLPWDHYVTLMHLWNKADQEDKAAVAAHMEAMDR